MSLTNLGADLSVNNKIHLSGYLKSEKSALYLLLFVVLLFRLCLMAMYPLLDTSEARYGEMTRKMVELGDWVTPMFDYGEPFWGKPPLSFWMQALSISLFGESEWALRLPSFLCLCLSCYLLIRWGREEYCEQRAVLAAIILSSCSLGFVAFGAVLTDPMLSVSLLLALYGFWRAVQYQDDNWALLGFFGLALGMLAKGPIALVLFVVPVFLFLLVSKAWRKLLLLPWMGGLILFFLVSMPWYLMAEWKTPGFWEYFFLGEHVYRFLKPGWSGDFYGNAHLHPRGYIWLYALVASLPWCLLPFFKFRSFGRLAGLFESRATLFLVFCALTPLVFFTLSRNILWTYVLPALPLLALLLAVILVSLAVRFRYLLVSAALVPIVLSLLLLDGRKFESWKNQKPIIQYWQTVKNNSDLLYTYQRRIYSAEFYSGGKARQLPTELSSLVGQSFYLIVRESYSFQERILQHACELKNTLNGSRIYYCEM